MLMDPKKAGSKKRLKAYQYFEYFEEETEEYAGYLQQIFNKKKQKKHWNKRQSNKEEK